MIASSKRRPIEISASILSADFSHLGADVLAAEAGGADRVHIDIMDGHFVPNITIGPLVVRALRPITKLPLEAHLMIEEPERYIEEFAKAGADIITVHVETCPHLHRTLQQIREAGAKPSVTLNPATPISSLEEVLDQVEMILVMTVNPGFGGQKIIPAAVEKVRRLRAWLDSRGLDCPIEVDGGVNAKTAQTVVDAGAEILVMGAAIFAAPEGAAEAIRTLRQGLA